MNFDNFQIDSKGVQGNKTESDNILNYIIVYTAVGIILQKSQKKKMAYCKSLIKHDWLFVLSPEK